MPHVRSPAVVVDIDGVVADVRHRLRHVESRPKDWPAFFGAADRDPPLRRGLEVVASALAAELTVVWLTGRPEWTRATTARWLDRHGMPGGPLNMRPAHDRRPA